MLCFFINAPHVPIQQAFGPGYDFFCQCTTFSICVHRRSTDTGGTAVKTRRLFWVGAYSQFQRATNNCYTYHRPLGLQNRRPVDKANPGNAYIPLNVASETPVIPSYISSAPPFFGLGQITLGELAVILFGSLLNVPWIWEAF
jgi:hypothetical protein